MTVLIAGGGIAGMALGLTCHQLGIDFKIFDSVRELRPLGVGINLQPTAVRELYDLGLADELADIGVQTKEFGLFSKKGLKVWTEPRGKLAGYKWPQYSVHRGKLHIMMYQTLMERAGPQCVVTGCGATGFENKADHAILNLRTATGETRSERGDIIIGADGLHSAIRAQMAPDQGDPKWGGSILWRGTTKAPVFRTGASMIMIGGNNMRFVAYPITEPDTDGNATINWIVNLNFGADHAWNKEDWSREADINDFLPAFKDMNLDWIDVQSIIKGSDRVWEYPCVDRDPLDTWTHDRVTLMGDAAHAAYPSGSNGAGSAIIDARELGAAFLEHGLTNAALQAYEDKMLPVGNRVTLMNRASGPDSILDTIDTRCGGKFDKVTDIIPEDEMIAHATKYKAAAGFGIDETNDQAATIPKDVKFHQSDKVSDSNQ